MNRQMEELLLKCTSILYAEEENGEQEQATCFFIKKGTKQYLVTSKHVLEKKQRIYLYLDIHHKTTDTYSYHRKVTLALNHAVKFHDIYDLAILNIDCIAQQNTETETYTYKTLDLSIIPEQYEMFSYMQEILIVGYPSGIHDTVSNLPVVRKGITATPVKNSYKNRKEFLINIPFLNGSSGSPVFAEVEGNVYLIGIEYSKILEKVVMDRKKNRLYHSDKYTVEMETGIGIAVRASALLELCRD